MTGREESYEYVTAGGVEVRRAVAEIPVEGAIEPVLAALDEARGALLASSYEVPGRYTRWDLGFVDPLLEVTARAYAFRVAALNDRGTVLLAAVTRAVAALPAVAALESGAREILGRVAPPTRRFAEEERSRQPSIFSVLRAIVRLFAADEERYLGLYGAFGYDLALQFEPLRLRLPRPLRQRDLVLYLPDEIVVVDHHRERAERRRYELVVDGASTEGSPRSGARSPYVPAKNVDRACDHAPGEYAAGVVRAREAFRRGDLFEVVPGQTFYEPCHQRPSEIFRSLRSRNPSPYGFLINLGGGEYLVGASPEMYVRVEGDRVETCPISGTIARGGDAVSDARQVRTLLNSAKDEAELTMCTDVDRNDKSRICRPGSVRVIGRRQIEMYSRLIHTVDHVEGRLREGFDALDAFLAHAWAVTVTGAPKAWAMQFLEDHEKSARGWYGGAVGLVGFDGSVNTGLTLRTIAIRDGVAEIRAGATLLYDSDPEEEEKETRLKAAALLEAVRDASAGPATVRSPVVGADRRVLLVDHHDSFVHTLANYLRQCGSEVVTLRYGFPTEEIDRLRPDLVVLSPGPGRPSDFGISRTLAAAIERGIAVFGVCLGLQGMVEHFGGELGMLPSPVHGKPTRIRTLGGAIFEGLPQEFVAGRYHSLFAVRERLPDVLRVTAESDDGVVMAVEHLSLPLAAVQFHPESILTLEGDVGLALVANVVRRLGRPSASGAACYASA